MAAVAGKVVTKNLEKIERCLFVGIPGEPLPPDPKHTPARWSEDLCICCTGTFFRSLFCPACALAEIQSYIIPEPRLTCCPDRPLPFLNSPWFLCGICLFGVLYEQHAVTKHILAGRLGLSDGCCKTVTQSCCCGPCSMAQTLSEVRRCKTQNSAPEMPSRM